MAFTSSNFHLRAGAVGDITYTYSTTDTMATVIAAGYFNNTDDDLNLAAGDRIYVRATDGNMWLKVQSISSGSVTTRFAGGNLPINTFATGTAAALANGAVGIMEVGTSIATASRVVLPTPYPGAEVSILKVDSGTQLFSFDAGGSGGTGVTFDSVGNRRITLQKEGEAFHVVGSSTTRWRINSMSMEASAAGQGGSRFIAGT